MRSHVRTIVVLAIALALVVLFLSNVNLWGVLAAIARARPEWLALSLLTTFANLAIRALRWKYLLEPLGPTTFASAFRATAVGFAASAVLPARAGEVIRPYFLARQAPRDQQGRMTATGAFATIILERLLDIVTVLALLASFVFVFGKDLAGVNPTGFALVSGPGRAALVSSSCQGSCWRAIRTAGPRHDAARAGAAVDAGGHDRENRREVRPRPGATRRPGVPGRAGVVAAAWLCIALGIWSMAMAFSLAIPFTGSFLMIALLTLGVAVPTPGAVGGFHEAFRVGATAFYGAPDEAAVGAAIVLHLFSIGPSLLLGLLFAAREGLNIGTMQRLADQAEQGHTA
jgi:uncharacterized membrane protein YbhN (UPF0104 family)